MAVTDEAVVSVLGMSGKDISLGLTWDYRNYAATYTADYNDSTINQQNIKFYSPLLAQSNSGLRQQQITERNNLAGAPLAKGGALAIGLATGAELVPAAGAFATAALQACKSNIILCVNRVGIWSGDMALGEALPTGIGAGALALTSEQKAADSVLGVGGLPSQSALKVSDAIA